MADLKTKYPATSSVALTISLASLASSGTLVAGRESTAVDNTTDLDLDHLLSGKIRVGTTPTTGTQIEVWVYAPISLASGTPTYPDVFDGTDSAETATSRNVLFSALKLAHTIILDSTTSNRDYFIPPISIAELFGGNMPTHWGVFVTHATVAALNATAGEHVLHYLRVQRQSV